MIVLSLRRLGVKLVITEVLKYTLTATFIHSQKWLSKLELNGVLNECPWFRMLMRSIIERTCRVLF